MLQIHPLLSTLLPNQYPGSTETLLRQLRQYCDSTEGVLMGQYWNSSGAVLGQYSGSTCEAALGNSTGTVLGTAEGQY